MDFWWGLGLSAGIFLLLGGWLIRRIVVDYLRFWMR